LSYERLGHRISARSGYGVTNESVRGRERGRLSSN